MPNDQFALCDSAGGFAPGEQFEKEFHGVEAHLMFGLLNSRQWGVGVGGEKQVVKTDH